MNGDRTFSAVYLAAGMSSRFGGRIKCLQEVGRHGETLLELSVRQLLDAHPNLDQLVVIVSDATYNSIHSVVGDRFLGLPVMWRFQRTPRWRKKPLGTVDALLRARDCIAGPFIVLNGDSLYGVPALRLVCDHICREHSPCMPGYRLRDVLPAEGRVNRAVIKMDNSGRLIHIVEQYNISMQDVFCGKYSGEELTSMNIFGFQAPDIFEFAERKFATFLHEMEALHQGYGIIESKVPREMACEIATTKEYILSTMLNDLLPEEGIQVQVLTCNLIRTPLELTNPSDFAFVKSHLDRVGL